MLQSPRLAATKLEDSFFAPKLDTLRKVTIPAAFRLCRETGRIDAFRLNWQPGMPNRPHRYWDSDVAKVIEGAANLLALQADPELEQETGKMIDLIISAQGKDGYLNSYYTAVEPDKRWGELSYGHELYCLGHLIESAVAWYETTGKRNFLNAMCRAADMLSHVFGKDKKRGCPGHPELEFALIRLYRTTGEKRYLELAGYFLNERGTEPNCFLRENPLVNTANLVADQPLKQRSTAFGHAVRLVYLGRGMAEAGAELGDRALFNAAVRMWENLTRRRMYVTGGIGSCQAGETVTHDWDLPLDRSYAESCASMGLAWYSQALLNHTGEGRFADLLELELYNGAVSGLGLDGESFFYANPQRNQRWSFEYGHVFKQRQKWFDTSCCPTNYCRFISRLPAMTVTESASAVQIHIPAAATVTLPSGVSVRIRGTYPWNGNFTVELLTECTVDLEIRIPAWCRKAVFSPNGRAATPEIINGYARLRGPFPRGCRIEVEWAMPVEILRAVPRIVSCAGRFALRRGPVIYCCEECDNPGIPGELAIDLSAGFQAIPFHDAGLGEITAITGRAYREMYDEGELYRSAEQISFAHQPQNFIAIPYAVWGNRHPGEGMELWLREY